MVCVPREFGCRDMNLDLRAKNYAYCVVYKETRNADLRSLRILLADVSLGLGKMSDLRRGDVVGFHGFRSTQAIASAESRGSDGM